MHPITALTAAAKALHVLPKIRNHVTSIYVQPTGLTGLNPFPGLGVDAAGGLPSAYVVELLGKNLGFNGKPAPQVPPKREFWLVIVNGKTGAAEPAVGGGWPPH